jgi:hypothetical protein
MEVHHHPHVEKKDFKEIFHATHSPEMPSEATRMQKRS